MKYCFGIDIGGTTEKLGLFQGDGVILDKWEIKTRTEREGINILKDAAAAVESKIAERGIDRDDILGIGVGVPAPVKDGVVEKTANLGWPYKDVAKELAELLKLPVKVGNDANVAALGEMWLGGGKGHKNLIMVTLGTGVGGGIIVNEHIMSGAHGAAGEIGHICVNYEEKDHCGCGRCGCLEQYASATGIARLARQKLTDTSRQTILKVEGVSAKMVFDAVKEGDEVAKEIADEFGRYLGYALCNIAVIVDPSVVVVGGGVSKAGEILLTYIRKYYQERAFFANRDTGFVLATLGNDAGICGAAKLVLE